MNTSRQDNLSPAEKRQLLAQLLEKKANKPQTFPLSFAQQRLWFLHQLEPGSPVYNMSLGLRFTGSLHLAALKQSLAEIIRRHQALRTTFPIIEGQPRQVVAPALALPLPLVDLQTLPQAEREAEAQRLAREEARQPFDLADGPLLKTLLFRLDADAHLLLVVVHHIVFDAWSKGIFMQELSTLYRAFSSGEPSPLPELAWQYTGFTHWQQTWLQDGRLASQLAYWQKHLAGAPAVLQLPADRPHPPIQRFQGGNERFQLSAELLTGLKSLSQQARSTLFMTLLAAFATLLSRYSSQEDIVVGSPIANRNRQETEALIGFLINTLLLRLDLSGNPPFLELLSRVRDVARDAYAHQDIPFETLVEALQPERSLSHAPLFQVMFVLQNAPTSRAALPGVKVEAIEIDNGTAKFDLTLFLEENEAGLKGRFEYNTDLFDRETITRMVGHFKTLLEGIVASPTQVLSALPLLAKAERYQLLVEWNNTQTAYPQEMCLHQLFEAQVERTPEGVALVFEGEQLTYRELDRRANQVAHHLQARGIGPERVVGICMERSIELVVGLLGILKAGGAYIPLDPTYPSSRLALMVTDTQMPVVLTQERFTSLFPGREVQVICLDTGWETIAQESQTPVNSGVKAENLAYVIYTSGSTGTPKGAMNTHRGICNRLLWMQEAYHLAETERVLQKTPFSFDVSVWEFFWPLLAGACLVVARPEGHKDSAYLAQVIAEQKITTVHFVPSMLQVFVEERNLERCAALKRVICSGEALPVDLAERFFARFPAHIELHNLYGPTEAAVDVTFWKCDPSGDLKRVPIGRPIANTQLYILDPQLQPVPIGVPGELHIAGAGLARGYLNRPQLTQEKFIPNPFSDEPEARLYKTGDLARYLPDGNLEYLGRLDHQVKVRGFRIELGEIETLLGQHPAVREAVVMAREDTPNQTRLVAYIVLHHQARVTQSATLQSDLRNFLQAKLPEYMLPAAFVALESLPLTVSGKVNRRLLPAPEPARPELVTAYAGPGDPIEEELVRLWADILGLDRVGVHDSFFELGGHSLLATKVISRLREIFHLEIPLRRLFETPTVAGMAQYIAALQWSTQTAPLSSGPERDEGII